MSNRRKKLYIKKVIRIIIIVLLLLIYNGLYDKKKEQKLTLTTFENTYINEAPKTFEELKVIYKDQKLTIIDLKHQIKSKDNEITELTNIIRDLESERDRLKINSTSRGEIRQYNSTNETLPHSKSGYSIEILNKMLVGTGLEGYGESFKSMEDTYNVNAMFAMGVAMHESANGFKKANTNNYFGFKGNNGWMSFNSPHDCIMYFGKLIHNYYSDRQTIQAIQSKYCPDGTPWASRVINHINILESKK